MQTLVKSPMLASVCHPLLELKELAVTRRRSGSLSNQFASQDDGRYAFGPPGSSLNRKKANKYSPARCTNK
jgi:hypothetical protein